MVNIEKVLQELSKPILYVTWKKYYLTFAQAIIRNNPIDYVTLAEALHTAVVICTSEEEEKEYAMESSHIREYGEIVVSLEETGTTMSQREILLTAINNAIDKRSLN